MTWIAHQAGDPTLTQHLPPSLRKISSLAGGHRSALESKMSNQGLWGEGTLDRKAT